MKIAQRPITILLADDDEDDRMMTQEALKQSHLANDLRFAVDGEDLMDYLKRRGEYTNSADAPVPGLILLDSICRARTGVRHCLKSRPILSCARSR